MLPTGRGMRASRVGGGGFAAARAAKAVKACKEAAFAFDQANELDNAADRAVECGALLGRRPTRQRRRRARRSSSAI